MPEVGPLKIAEFVADNDEAHADGHGEYPDWIEIRNAGTATFHRATFPDAELVVDHPEGTGSVTAFVATGDAATAAFSAGGVHVGAASTLHRSPWRQTALVSPPAPASR